MPISPAVSAREEGDSWSNEHWRAAVVLACDGSTRWTDAAGRAPKGTYITAVAPSITTWARVRRDVCTEYMFNR